VERTDNNVSKCKRHFTAICDSGATASWISNKAFKGMARRAAPKMVSQTTVGRLESWQAFDFEDLLLPEFSTSKHISKFAVRACPQDVCYDMIIGRNLLTRLGIILDYNEKQIV
jgi:hypothetical protein